MPWREIYKIVHRIEDKLECRRVEFKLKYSDSKFEEKDKDSWWFNRKKKDNVCYSLFYKYKFERLQRIHCFILIVSYSY